MQITNYEVCVIGGPEYSPTLLTHFYDVPCSCLHIDISTGIVSEKAPMNSERTYGFGVSLLNNFIYVVAGIN